MRTGHGVWMSYPRGMRLLPIFLLACSGPIGGYCADLSDCTGADRRACVDALEEDAASSKEAGCQSEWRDWSQCLAQESECVGALYTPMSSRLAQLALLRR